MGMYIRKSIEVVLGHLLVRNSTHSSTWQLEASGLETLMEQPNSLNNMLWIMFEFTNNQIHQNFLKELKRLMNEDILTKLIIHSVKFYNFFQKEYPKYNF